METSNANVTRSQRSWHHSLRRLCTVVTVSYGLMKSMPLKLLVFAAEVALVTVCAVGARAAPICLPPSPLPSAPGAGAQSVSFVGSTSAVSSYSAIFWREPCLSNPATSALFLHVTPPPGEAVLFRALFVVQNGVQSNAYMYEARDDMPLSPFAGLI